MQKLPIKIKLRVLLFVFIFVFSTFLLVLPASFFDNGQSICVSVLLFNKQCYACGMTRAIQHLIHLDFHEAYHYNWLAFIVFPLIVYLLMTEFLKLVKEIRTFKKSEQKKLEDLNF